MKFDVDIIGVKDLDRVFNNLPRSMQRKAYMQALRAGAEPVKSAAQANIQQVSRPYTGVLSRKSTLRIYNLRKYRGNYRVSVQIRRGLINTKAKGVRVGLYAAVLEYGKKGQPPRPWIRKAIREQQAAAISALTTEMNKRIVDALKDARSGI
jgi:HK97 gp10 family phage protein